MSDFINLILYHQKEPLNGGSFCDFIILDVI